MGEYCSKQFDLQWGMRHFSAQVMHAWPWEFHISYRKCSQVTLWAASWANPEQKGQTVILCDSSYGTSNLRNHHSFWSILHGGRKKFCSSPELKFVVWECLNQTTISPKGKDKSEGQAEVCTQNNSSKTQRNSLTGTKKGNLDPPTV